jgi:hypothetical protein
VTLQEMAEFGLAHDSGSGARGQRRQSGRPDEFLRHACQKVNSKVLVAEQLAASGIASGINIKADADYLRVRASMRRDWHVKRETLTTQWALAGIVALARDAGVSIDVLLKE